MGHAMEQKELEDREQSIRVLGKIQYFFPIVFLVFAFVFYINGRVPALLAWIFGAVGVMEYFLIAILIDSRKRKLDQDLGRS
jgi:hypothetical protein